jgi:protein tyrosine/serine phosphatase
LKGLEIKTIINLRPLYSDSDEIKDTGLCVEELSVKAWHIEDADVVRVLRIIRKRENGPFLIHCSYGADRVGVMITMFRVVEARMDERRRDSGNDERGVWIPSAMVSNRCVRAKCRR